MPSFTAFAVVGLLEQYFGDLVDYGFTAAMEDDLDEIAQGARGGPALADPLLLRRRGRNGTARRRRRRRARPTATDGRHRHGRWPATGGANRGLKSEVADHLGEIDAREINSIPIGDDAEGQAVVARVGRYGPYLQRGEDRASIPEDLPPDELTLERAEELLAAPVGGPGARAPTPSSGLPVIARTGRFGPYVQLGEAVDGGDKPRTASLFKTMGRTPSPSTRPSSCSRLPRSVGLDPATGEEIVALNGRFGPYLKKGTDTRSLTGEEQLFTVTLDEALALFAQPKRGRGRTAAAPLQGAGRGPRHRAADGAAGRPLRSLRDRRDDQRLAAQGRRRGDHHPRAGRRAAGRPPGGRAPGQAGQEGGQGEEGGQEDDGQEDRGQEDGGQEDRRPRRPAATKAAATKADGARPRRPGRRRRF